MSDYSINEVCARAKLAAKGAGYTWGMAEEVSRSVNWLVSRGLPSLEMLASLLDSIPHDKSVHLFSPCSLESNVRSQQEWLCPIASGCLISDLYQSFDAQNNLLFTHLRSPLLLVPFIADLASQSKVSIGLRADDQLLVTDGFYLRYSSEQFLISQQENELICQVLDQREEPDKLQIENGGPERTSSTTADAHYAKTTDRVVVEHTVWERLGAYAQKTYAPSTDASRLSGAGAGLNDND